MKKQTFLIVLLGASACWVFVMLYNLGGPAAGLLGGLAYMVGFIYLYEWIAGMIKAKQYGNRYENIYVVENPPGYNLEEMLDDLQGLMVAVPKGKVLEAVLEEKKLLEKAGNKRGVEVIPIHYQSGVHVNETVQEYIDRLTIQIKADRSARHNQIKEKDPEWYLKNHHGERERSVYEWNGKANKNV